jgi:hypothetical protein
MAVDTRKKRASALNVGGAVPVTLPTPDGEIDAGDRRHLAGLYSGLEDEEPPDAPPTFGITGSGVSQIWTAGITGSGITGGPGVVRA